MLPEGLTRVLTTLVFIGTYILVSASRLRLLPIGRLGGAILGAVLMVAIGSISPQETYAAINHDTILLLFAMMFLSVYLEKVGFFEHIGGGMLAYATTPGRLLVAVALLAGVGSAFLVNDTVCLFLTPVIVTACKRARLPLGPYLIALATSANIGSAATPVGNPQNMIIASVGHISFAQFSAYAAPAAVVGWTMNLALLWFFYADKITVGGISTRYAPAEPRTTSVLGALQEDKRLPLMMLVLLGVIIGFLLGLHPGYTAMAGAVVLLLLERRDPRPILEKIDWPMLVFFISLFIVIAAFNKTGYVDQVWHQFAPILDLDHWYGVATMSALMLVGSNLVSNVPMVLLASPHLIASHAGLEGWIVLGFTTTVAGNLTLMGSMANIIVAERARSDYVLGFGEYLRFGLASTLIVLTAGVLTVVLICRALSPSVQ